MYIIIKKNNIGELILSELTTGQLILIIVLAVLLITAVSLLARALYEPYVLKVTKRKMFPGAKCSDFRKQVLPVDSSEKPGIRLIFFSDLHADFCRIKPERLISAIKDANSSAPIDAVVFGGDICNKYNVTDIGLSYLRKISDACKELGIPFYGVTGNHDHGFEPAADKCGFESIENKQISMTSRSTGKTVILSGVDDSGRENRIWYKVPAVPSDCVSVAVIHNPDSILHFEADDHVDFMLSGHLHAGQIKMPFRLEFVGLRPDKLPWYDVIEGVFEHNGTTLFISRGLGCNLLPLRLGAYPEVSVVEIYD